MSNYRAPQTKKQKQAAYGGYCQMARSLGKPVKTYGEFEVEDMLAIKKEFKERRAVGMTMTKEALEEAVTVSKWGELLHEYGYDEHPHFAELTKYFEHHQKLEQTQRKLWDGKESVRFMPTQMYALLTLRQLDPDHYNLCIIDSPVQETTTETFELPAEEQFIRYENKSFANIEQVMSDSLTHVPERLAQHCKQAIYDARSKKFDEWVPNLWIHMLPEEACFVENGKDLLLRYKFRLFAK